MGHWKGNWEGTREGTGARRSQRQERAAIAIAIERALEWTLERALENFQRHPAGGLPGESQTLNPTPQTQTLHQEWPPVGPTDGSLVLHQYKNK